MSLSHHLQHQASHAFSILPSPMHTLQLLRENKATGTLGFLPPSGSWSLPGNSAQVPALLSSSPVPLKSNMNKQNDPPSSPVPVPPTAFFLLQSCPVDCPSVPTQWPGLPFKTCSAQGPTHLVMSNGHVQAPPQFISCTPNSRTVSTAALTPHLLALSTSQMA